MTRVRILIVAVIAATSFTALAQGRGAPRQTPAAPAAPIVLRPARVFDGRAVQSGWVVVVRGARIDAAGPAASTPVPPGARTIDLPDATLLPGLIDAHSHVLLHPYNETPWNDQVAHELLGLRIARAVNHLRATLEAGFTTIRDLGTEGAGYADAGLRQAIGEGVIPGPRLITATRAIVATGTYAPRGYPAEWQVPQGAEEADGVETLIRVVRDQAGKGAEWIKVYGDYRAGPSGETVPTFTQDEMNAIVATAASLGRPVAVHASSPEGMRRAVLAGAATIEHGDGGTAEIFALMKSRGVALCPTLAAGHAVSQYGGWRPGQDPEPARVRNKRASFRLALDAGVTISAGSDVGVFAHGDNARELELMVDYGMSPVDALASATSVDAGVLRLDTQIGRIAPGLLADILVVDGDPVQDISALRRVRVVIKSGKIVRGN
jgi:imidazolonepropionase-like amidohydrolase